MLVHLLGRHATAEEARAGEVPAVARVRSAHHVLGIEGLLGELGHGEGAVLLGATAGERREAHHEEVEPREWHHVHCELAQVAVELTREAEGACGAADSRRNQVVQVTVSWGGELEGAEADVVKGFVVERKALVRVLHKLMHRQSGVVWLYHGVRNLRRWDDGVSGHDAVRVLLTDLGDEEGAHAGTGATTHGVGQLEAL